MPPTPIACETCAVYKPVTEQVGECRRFPPRFHPHASITEVRDTPTMTQTVLCAPTYWCGEWRAK